MVFRGAILALAVGLFASHAATQDFEHAVTGGATPWTGELQASDPNDLTFVIHSDLTGGERPGIFELAARQMALLPPELVISVGDLIEGGGSREELIAEWESFDERAALIGAPVIYVCGNHDLSSE